MDIYILCVLLYATQINTQNVNSLLLDASLAESSGHWQGCRRARSARTVRVAAASFPVPVSPQVIGIFAAVALLVLAIKKVLDTPSRTYDPENPNVGESYDDWER